jgi:putative oxidoreductase
MRLTHDERATAPRDFGITVIRVVAGLVFFMHGWQKLFMMGVGGVERFFGSLGIPAASIAAPGVAYLELIGGAALILGLLTRWVAIPLTIDMLVASLLVHIPAGFFVPNGVELVLLLLASAVTLIVAGPGALAIDQIIGGRARGGASVEARRRPAAVTNEL